MLIIKNILNNNLDLDFTKEIDEYKFDGKIMTVFEEFTDKIKIVCVNIIKEKKENKFKCENMEEHKFIFKNYIRPKIYLL